MTGKILEGDRAIITGASAGIGASIARRFAEEGASIWAVGGGDTEGLQKTIDACVKAGGKAGGRCYDLSQSSRAVDVIRDGADFLGGVDILVNCAGARLIKPFLETTDEDVERVFEVNAKAPYLASREAARIMVSQGGGRILMIGSIYGERGALNFSLYCTTKTTMHNLARAIAVELGPMGVRANCLLPGLTLSDRVEFNLSRLEKQNKGHTEKKKELIPNRRFATPDEMAEAALFIVSKQNDFMNGAMIPSDGGWMAG